MSTRHAILSVPFVTLVLAIAALCQPPSAGEAAPAGRKAVPPDTAVVDLTLPPGATASASGGPYTADRRVVFRGLVPGRLEPRDLSIRLADGRQIARKLLLRGGWQVELALPAPGAARPELVLQTGHTGKLFSAALSGDGRLAITGSEDKTAMLWDVATGRRLHTLPFDFWVYATAFRPGATEAVTCCRREVTFWDPATGRKLRELAGHTEYVHAMAFTADGQRLATAAKSQAFLWDLASGRMLQKFAKHTDDIVSVALSRDGGRLLTGSRDKTAIAWDTATGRALHALEGHADKLYCVAITPDGKLGLTSGFDPTAIVWDLETGRKVRGVEPGASYISAVAFSPDGRQFLTSAWGSAVLWDTESGRRLREFKEGAADVTTLAFSADGRQIIAGDYRQKAVLWDTATARLLQVFHGYANCIEGIAFSPDGRQLLIGSNHGTAALCRPDSGQSLQTLSGHRSQISAVAFTSDGRHAVTGSWDTTAILWDAHSGAKVREFSGGHTDCIECLALSPDGTLLATGSRDQKTVVWNTATGEKVRTPAGFPGWLRSLAFAPNGDRLLTVSEDGATLWETASGKKVRFFAGRIMHASAFTPDGRQVLLTPSDEAVLYDADTGAEVRKFLGHKGWIRSAAFTPDGRYLLTGSTDRTARLWDAATGKPLRVFEGHINDIESAALHPDGRLVATGSLDGTVRLWDIATGQELLWLLSLDEGKDFLAVTPEGLFDGSQGGREKVAFRVGEGANVAPVDRFFQDFYRPGLLGAIWQGEQPQPEVQMGKRLPPALRVLSPQPGEVKTLEAAVDVEATDRGGGVARLAIYQNGARVLAPGETRRQGNKVYRRFDVLLVEGENRLRVTAATDDGSWESEPAEVVLRYEKAVARSDLHLVAVGVSRYADANLNLRYAAADAQAIAELFRRRGKSLYGEVRVTPVLDAEATKAAIQQTLKQVSAGTQPRDTLVLFLAGHGAMVGQRYYFIPHELRKQSERLEDDIRRQGLPADELSDYLGAAKALKRVLIVDTCASGGALSMATKGRAGFELRGAIERLSRAQGVFTIAASAASEQAQEAKELGHGVLSYSLLAGLKAVDSGPLAGSHVQPSGPDRVVDILEWFSYASGQVPRLTEKLYGQSQDVQTSTQGSAFPVLGLED